MNEIVETEMETTTVVDTQPELKKPPVVTGKEYLQSETIEEKFRWASAYIKGGMVPQSFKTPAQVLAGLEFAKELNVPPLVALRNIAVINGTPSIWGELPLALVRKSEKLEWITEILFDKDFKEISFDNKNLTSEVFGALCKTKRVGEPEPNETWFTFDDAKQANLTGRGVWKSYPRRMLQMRARSQNLKDNFSDALTGIAIAEYDYNYMPNYQNKSARNVNHSGEEVRDVASEINKQLDGEV